MIGHRLVSATAPARGPTFHNIRDFVLHYARLDGSSPEELLGVLVESCLVRVIGCVCLQHSARGTRWVGRLQSAELQIACTLCVGPDYRGARALIRLRAVAEMQPVMLCAR